MKTCILFHACLAIHLAERQCMAIHLAERQCTERTLLGEKIKYNTIQYNKINKINTLYVQYAFRLRSPDSSVSIATRYELGGPGIKSRWGEIFRTCPDRSRGPPSLLYNGYRVFPGSKAAGAWRWPPTPFSAEVKEIVELYLYSPSGLSWPVAGWTLPLLTLCLSC